LLLGFNAHAPLVFLEGCLENNHFPKRWHGSGEGGADAAAGQPACPADRHQPLPRILRKRIRRYLEGFMILSDIFDSREKTIKTLELIRCDDEDYLNSIATLNLGEICPDIVLLNYERAIKENYAIQLSFPDIATQCWKLGDSGQGDTWLWLNEHKCIAWLDHDLEKFDLEAAQPLHINFSQFIELAFVIRNFETKLDLNEMFFVNPVNMKEYELILENISVDLSIRYPYRCF
jgi:hypothetical protein